MRKKTKTIKKRVNKRFLLYLLVGIVLILSCLAVAYRLDIFSKNTEISLNTEMTLRVNENAIINDSGQTIKFRFTDIQPGDPSSQPCGPYDICTSGMPTVSAELTYSGNVYRGSTFSPIGLLSLGSYTSSGQHEIVPYSITITDMNYKKSTGTVKIEKIDHIQVALGEQFTLQNGGLAILDPGNTGVRISFATCGFGTPCISSLDYILNNERVTLPYMYSYEEIMSKVGKQYVAKAGAYVEKDGIRLRLIESDDKTYATFIFESY